MINFDFDVLYAIQNIRTIFLDKVFVIITSIPGEYGQMWIVLGISKHHRVGVNIEYKSNKSDVIEYVAFYLRCVTNKLAY